MMDVFVELGVDCNATGSATWECAGHHVTFSIHGPDEVRMQQELTHRAAIDVVVAPACGQHTLKETELELYLISVLERLIDCKAFPRTKISGRVCIVNGEAADPRTVAAALNAMSLALLQSGITLHATLVALCIPLAHATVTVALDVSHPKLSGSRRAESIPALFSLFTGHSGRVTSKATQEQQPAGFEWSMLTNLLKSTDESTDSAPDSILAQARSLADVMITQLAVGAV